MPETREVMIRHLSTVVMAMSIVGGIVFGAVSCTSFSTTNVHSPTTSGSIHLERSVYARDAIGRAIQVPAGRYRVKAVGGHLELTSDSKEHYTLEAHHATHGESVAAPTPFSFPDDNGEHVVLLLYPDGTALEAIGSYHGIYSRALRQVRAQSSTRLIPKPFRGDRLSPRTRPARPFHFTFRIPVDLNYLNPEIDQIKIKCHTYKGIDATKYENRIGDGESVSAVHNRQLHKTVVVRFNAGSGREPEEAERYHCMLLLHKPGIGFRQPRKFGTYSAAPPAWVVSAEDTPFLRTFTGDLP